MWVFKGGCETDNAGTELFSAVEVVERGGRTLATNARNLQTLMGRHNSLLAASCPRTQTK